MESLNVLIVEDEPADAALIERTLRRMEGFKVEVKLATDLTAARRAVDQHRFEAALIDYSIRGDCGLDLVPHLTSPKQTCAPILLTGQLTHAVHRRAISAGVLASLPKDRLDPLLLGTAISHALQTRYLLAALHSCSDQLARARNERLDVAGNFAHLLANALQPVVNCAAGLEDAIVSQGATAQVAGQAKHVRQLTTDLNVFCRDTSALVSEIHASREPAACIDLQEVVVDAVRLVAKCGQREEVRIDVAYLDHPIPVRANRSALLRALVDVVLACAAHMMPDGRLEIKLATTADNVCLGIGSRNFASRPDNIRHHGALSVARSRALLDRYGGELELRATPEPNGCVVLVRLPLTSWERAKRYSSMA